MPAIGEIHSRTQLYFKANYNYFQSQKEWVTLGSHEVSALTGNVKWVNIVKINSIDRRTNKDIIFSSEALEPCQTFMMELFFEVFNDFSKRPLGVSGDCRHIMTASS